MQPLVFRFILASTTALIFGQPVESFENEEQEIFGNSFDYASLISVFCMRLQDFTGLTNHQSIQLPVEMSNVMPATS